MALAYRVLIIEHGEIGFDQRIDLPRQRERSAAEVGVSEVVLRDLFRNFRFGGDALERLGLFRRRHVRAGCSREERINTPAPAARPHAMASLAPRKRRARLRQARLRELFRRDQAV